MPSTLTNCLWPWLCVLVCPLGVEAAEIKPNQAPFFVRQAADMLGIISSKKLLQSVELAYAVPSLVPIVGELARCATNIAEDSAREVDRHCAYLVCVLTFEDFLRCIQIEFDEQGKKYPEFSESLSGTVEWYSELLAKFRGYQPNESVEDPTRAQTTPWKLPTVGIVKMCYKGMDLQYRSLLGDYERFNQLVGDFFQLLGQKGLVTCACLYKIDKARTCQEFADAINQMQPVSERPVSLEEFGAGEPAGHEKEVDNEFVGTRLARVRERTIKCMDLKKARELLILFDEILSEVYAELVRLQGGVEVTFQEGDK